MQSRKRTDSSRLSSKYRSCLLYILVFTLFIILSGVALSRPALTYATARIGPLITWDSTMIYPGQNNGNPWGPPGEQALVHGQSFIFGQQLDLVLVSGNSNANPNLCRGKATRVAQITVSSSGTFETNFIWPKALNQPGQVYSICALGANNLVIGPQDSPGPFTVLTRNPPSINLAATTVAAGGTLTVTGQNWVPDQQVEVDVTLPNHSGSVASIMANSGDGLHGTFSTSVAIPANTPAGTYAVTAFSTQSNLLSTSYTQTNLPLTITAVAATPTATPTAVVTPTATATAPTQTPSATATVLAGSSTNGNNGNSSGGGDNKNIVFLLLMVLAVVVLAIGGLLLFMLAQRKREIHPQFQANVPGSGTGQMSQYAAGPGYNPQTQGNVRACVRCGNLLAPNSLICNTCGLHNGLPFDSDGPTQAY